MTYCYSLSSQTEDTVPLDSNHWGIGVSHGNNQCFLFCFVLCCRLISSRGSIQFHLISTLPFLRMFLSFKPATLHFVKHNSQDKWHNFCNWTVQSLNQHSKVVITLNRKLTAAVTNLKTHKWSVNFSHLSIKAQGLFCFSSASSHQWFLRKPQDKWHFSVKLPMSQTETDKSRFRHWLCKCLQIKQLQMVTGDKSRRRQLSAGAARHLMDADGTVTPGFLFFFLNWWHWRIPKVSHVSETGLTGRI